MRLETLAVLCAALIGLAAPRAEATPTCFSFKDVEIEAVFQTIAILGKFNVVTAATTPHHRVHLHLKDVEPFDALHAVAAAHGLRVKRLPWKTEGTATVTYLVGPPATIAQTVESGSSRAVPLRFRTAGSIARALAPQVDRGTLRVSVDERTNHIVLHGASDAMDEVEKLVKELDRPGGQLRLEMALVAGTAAKPEPVWQGSTMLVNGEPAAFALDGDGRAAGTWHVSSVAGEAQARINAEGFCVVAIKMEAKAGDRSARFVALKFKAEQQINPGDEVEVGSLEIAPGQIARLRVRAVPLDPNPPAPPEIDLDALGEEPDRGTGLDGLTPPPPSPSPAGGDGLDLEGI